jgi:enoyl-CoA hydratase/carnithine racemase
MAGTYTTPRIVGMAKACEVIFTGKLYSGEEAFALGLVNRVTPTAKVLDEAMSLAREIAANAPIAVRLAKKALYKNDAELLDAAIEIESEHQAYTWTTEDAKEGITAMTEKRTPKFQGR